MPLSQAINLTRGTVVAQKLREARRTWERARGLIASPPLKDGEGLLIEPTNWIHSFGMPCPIDALYLNHHLKVVGLSSPLRPNRIGPWMRKARMVIELPAGTIAGSGTQVGDQIAIERAVDAQSS